MHHALDKEIPFEPNFDRTRANEPKNIPGWGMDADPENDPTYPMKKWNGADHERLNYDRPPQQPVDMEILHSNERPSVTSVFGTSTPPEGVSGQIRRYAFRYSENSLKHWLPLVIADRVGMVEGIIDDMRKGIIPNVFAERGWQAEWKYNKKGVFQNLALGVVITSALILWFSRGKKGNA